MSQERFWTLLSKKLSGEASDEELEELERLIHQHPEWQYAIPNLEDLWNLQSPAARAEDEEDAYMLHLHRMQEKGIPFGEEPVLYPAEANFFHHKKRNNRKWWLAAAAIVIAIMAGFFLIQQPDKKAGSIDTVATQLNEISTKPGSKSKVQLPDGSIVWLNAGSKLTYDKQFGNALREVILKGEGFFDVVKMPDKPFIIHTTAIDIKVLGTTFNVKAYPDEATETSLIKGRIEVSIKGRPMDKIILSPNEKLVVKNTSLSAKEANASVSSEPDIAINKLKYYNAEDSTMAETGWIENKLVFTDESYEEVIVKMERWYGVKIEIQNEQLKRKRFTGIFKNENIDQALEALMIAIPFRYEKMSDKIIIHQ